MNARLKINKKYFSVLLSIVIPCFNEQEVLFETYRRIKSVTSKFHPLETEIIFVDDGSKDNTPSILRDIALKNKNIKIIKLARNFGHQIDSSIGDAVVLIDADLQDPPEIIPEMIKKWQEGYDVVYGTRIERKGETLFKKSDSLSPRRRRPRGLCERKLSKNDRKCYPLGGQ